MSFQRGVTLIELLIVVVIIALFAAMLYPNYTSSVRQAKRSDAIKSVQQVAHRLEKFMSYCNAYTNKFDGTLSEDADGNRCTGLGLNDASATNMNSELGLYQLAISTTDCVSGSQCMGYTIRATAQSGQTKDTHCRTFIYSSRGVKTSLDAGGGDSTGDCWS